MKTIHRFVYMILGCACVILVYVLTSRNSLPFTRENRPGTRRAGENRSETGRDRMNRPETVRARENGTETGRTRGNRPSTAATMEVGAGHSLHIVKQTARMSIKQPRRMTKQTPDRQTVLESPCPLSQKGSFADHDVLSTALVSFPGSGNSWTRHLLTTASGVQTGTVYNERKEIYISTKTKEKAKRLIVVKTHELPEETRKHFPFERCVLLIRSPYEALLADFNRQAGRFPNHHNIREPKGFKEWPGYVSKEKGQWSRLYLSWVKVCRPPNLHVLVYSRMMHDLQHELQDLFRFLNDSAITPMMHCAIRNREGTAHRKEHAWQHKLAVCSENNTQFLNTAIDEVQAAFEAATGQSFEDFQNWKR